MTTTTIIHSRTTAIWLLLVAATIATWQLGHGVGLGDSRQAGAAILVVAFAKVRLVILDFMEIRAAPGFMRVAAEAWVIVAGALMIALFLRAPFVGP